LKNGRCFFVFFFFFLYTIPIGCANYIYYILHKTLLAQFVCNGGLSDDMSLSSKENKNSFWCSCGGGGDDGFRVSDDGGGPKNIYAGGKDWMIA
jgi:hypothetical protein